MLQVKSDWADLTDDLPPTEAATTTARLQVAVESQQNLTGFPCTSTEGPYKLWIDADCGC